MTQERSNGSMESMRWQQWLIVVLAVLCGLACVKMAIELIRVLSFEVQGAIDSDVAIYITVGKAILQGLTPYADIFESKPPGIFLLMALSLLLTGNEILARAVSVLGFVLLPVSIAFFGWKHAEKSSRVWQSFMALLGLLLGLLATLYLEERSGLQQTESFGTFFAALYAFGIFWKHDHVTWKRTVLLSIALLGAIGMKEPFVITVFGIALAGARDPRHFLRIFIIPLACAAAVGVILMALIGYLIPYLTLQVSAMLGGRLGDTSVEPHWIRAFAVGRVFANLTTYYTAAFFGYLMGFLWLMFPAVRSHKTGPLESGISALQSLLTYNAMVVLMLVLVAWNVGRQGMFVEGLDFAREMKKFLLFAVPIIPLLYVEFRRHMLWSACVGMVIIYLAALVVGIGIYVGNHFAFAVPLYIAIILLFLKRSGSDPQLTIVTIGTTLLALATVVTYQPNEKHLQHLEERTNYTKAALSPIVERFDGMMTACGYDNYFGPAAYQEFAFSKFVTVGPLPIPAFHRYMGEDHPLFEQTRQNVFLDADVLVHPEPEFLGDISGTFTEVVPDCAKPFLPIKEGWKVYFRK